jgi:hypothetical protein
MTVMGGDASPCTTQLCFFQLMFRESNIPIG